MIAPEVLYLIITVMILLVIIVCLLIWGLKNQNELSDINKRLRAPDGACRECNFKVWHHANCPIGRLGL